MSVNWNYPTTMWIGENRIDDLSLACKELNILNPLFVTDKDLVSLPMTEEIIANLKNSFGKLDIFSDFAGNPKGKNITEGVKIYNKNSCDGVIAFGGGSALDVGKAIAFMCGQTRPLWDFEDIGDYWKRAEESKISPIIAIPTTAGTGSETGRASAIINEGTGVKKIIFHPKFMPRIVILDPILTLDLPPRITAATGMDALAHNLEAFCAHGFHPMADGIASKVNNLSGDHSNKSVHGSAEDPLPPANPSIEDIKAAILMELENFAEAIRMNKEPEVSLQAGASALEVAYQILNCFS